MLKLQSSLKVACMTAAALTAFSCSQDDLTNQSVLIGNTTIEASFEGVGIGTRTSVNDANKVVWNKDDAFGLFYTSDTQTSPKAEKFTASTADGTSTSASFGGTLSDGVTTSYAVYPYDKDNMSLTGNTVTMALPAEFTYTTASNGPMYAPASDVSESLSFKHLAGLLKLTISKGITASAKKFVITADKNIAGTTCTADLSTTDPTLAVQTTGASKTITVNLNITDDSNDNITTFYIPIPVGTYTTLSAKLLDGSSAQLFEPKEWTNITVERAGMMTASFGYVKIDADTQNDITKAISDAIPTGEQTTPISTELAISSTIDATAGGSGISSIPVPVAKNSNVVLSLASIPTTSEDAPLVLKDAATDIETVEPAAAVNTVTVAIPKVQSDGTAPNFTITMPKTTVELDATGTEGTTYGKIIAKTATSTLVIKKGVTVKNLVVKGGNVRVAGTIEAISKDESLSGTTIYLIKEAGATIPEQTIGFTVVDAAVYDMMMVAKNGGTYTLNSDVTFSEPLVVESAMTLDLNGHSITPKDNSALNKVLNTQDAMVLVRRGTTLTINDNTKSGSISCESNDNISTVIKLTDSNDESGDKANSPAKLIINSGTLKGKYFAICGHGSRDNTELTITGGTIISTSDYAIYSPQQGTTTISGGEITGAGGAIALQDGTLNISDNAALTSEGTMTYDDNTGDGTRRLLNAAICIPARYGECTVNISGGTFTANSTSTTIDDTYNKTQTEKTRTIKVSGGTFSDPSALVYLADNAIVNVALTKNCETTALYIPGNRTVTMDLNKKKLTVKADKVPENITIDGMTKPNANVLIGGSLTLKNGSIENNKKGMALVSSAAKLELDGITYTTTRENHSGIFNDPNVEGSAITVKNSTITSADYAINTNALTNPVGSTTIVLENSTFTASETALMVNIPSKITVKECTFNGGWQGVFLRGGTATFTNSHINLVFVSSYATSNTAQGSTWASGNQAPAAALTAGNRSNSAYDYKTKITLNNTIFSNSGTDKGGKTATDYPAIYIDTESVSSKPNQGVEFTYDTASKTSFDAAGKGLVIGNKDNVKVNGSTPQ